MKLQAAVDKLFSHKMFSNKYFLYAVVAASILTNYVRISARHYEVVGFFILVGIIMMNFSKNIAVVLTVCLLLTQIIMAGKAVREGLDNMPKISRTLTYINNDNNHFPGISGDWAHWLEQPKNQTKYKSLYDEAKKLNDQLKLLNEMWDSISKTKDPKKIKTKKDDRQCLTYKYDGIKIAGLTERCMQNADPNGLKYNIDILVKNVRAEKKNEAMAKKDTAKASATTPAASTATATPTVTPVAALATASNAQKPKPKPKAAAKAAAKATIARLRGRSRLTKQPFSLLSENDDDIEDGNAFDFMGPSDISGLTQGTTNLMTKQKDLFTVMNSMTPLIENAKKMLGNLDLSKLQA